MKEYGTKQDYEYVSSLQKNYLELNILNIFFKSQFPNVSFGGKFLIINVFNMYYWIHGTWTFGSAYGTYHF